MTLLDTRQELIDALNANGIPTSLSAGERVQIPGVIVSPADPWIVSAGTLARQQRISWEVVPVSGRTDAEGTLQILDQLICDTWATLVVLPGWTTPQISAPRTLAANGADQLASVLSLSRLVLMDAAVSPRPAPGRI